MIFDTHAHYDDEQFDTDRETLLASMPEQGVGTIVNVSATYESCDRVVELVKRHSFMYAAVGIHPDEVGSLNEERFQQMEELCKQEKVVAVGEIGLDYYWDNESHDVQKEWFIRQLDLARELDLPVLIHSRDSKEQAKEYVKLGYYIGVGGVVTFKNARKLKETVEEIPLTSIVLETDCPYLAPVPFRGKRNNSSYIKYVAEEIAEIKGISYEAVVGQTEKNARDLYNLTEV